MTRTWKVPGYRATREIGRGVGGTTVLAICERTGDPVVVRYLPDGADRDRLRAEAPLLATVDDGHVVRLLGYVEGAGAALITEPVDGVSLATVLTRHGPTEPESALCVLADVLRGLAAVHARGVVHRGCTPANVLVTAAGQTKLMVGDPLGGPTDVRAAVALLVECVTGTTSPDLDQALDLLPESLRALTRWAATEPPALFADAGALLDRLARAGYGGDWEERGRRGLGRRAALLAPLFPPTRHLQRRIA